MSDLGLEFQASDQLRALIRKSGLPLKTFAEAMGWQNSQTLNWWINNENSGSEICFKNLESLAKYFGISVESLLEGSYDFDLIRKRILEGPSVLPSAYSENASSYVRTSAHIVEYLSMLYGRRFADQILNKMNIHPLFFENLDNKINLNFYIDIFNELSRVGIPDNEIASLACYIFLRLRDTDLGRKFRFAKDYQSSYAILAENATLFETNFEYDFQIDKDKIRIIAKPTEAELFLSRKSPQDYKRLLQYRKNVFSWFPTLSNLGPLSMKTPKCILRGDTHTVYEARVPDKTRGRIQFVCPQ